MEIKTIRALRDAAARQGPDLAFPGVSGGGARRIGRTVREKAERSGRRAAAAVPMERQEDHWAASVLLYPKA